MFDTTIPPEELVTSTPVQNLYNEFIELLPFGPHFMSISVMMFINLEHDKCGNTLRSALLPLHGYMYTVIQEMTSALSSAASYYSPRREEREALEKVLTKDHIRKFLDDISRMNQIYYGQRMLAALEEAIPILRDQALPLLSGIELDLHSFVKDYKERHYSSQKRSDSWLPFAVQDLVWGSLEPTTQDLSGIEALPQQLNDGIQRLQKLPGFLENVKDHFQRLMALTRTDFESLGYSSPEEFKSLHATRLRCSSLFFDMARISGNLLLPFALSSRFRSEEVKFPRFDLHNYT
ncbi:hypothetical protein CPB86DRAFT_761024 [Serendipita vermifera]|nr:hypothetical protein CPB86DRAFT_761024 [Serendipita vermifera]